MAGLPGRALETAEVYEVISTFHPVVGGAQRATRLLCRSLSENGLDVAVLTRRLPGTASFETVDGTDVFRLGHPSPSKWGACTFAAHLLWILSKRSDRDVVLHVHNPETPLLAGAIAKVALRYPLLITLHTDPALRFSLETKKSSRLALIRRVADRVGVLDEAWRELLAREGFDPARIVVLCNGIDTGHYRPPSPAERREARRRLGIPEDRLVFLFAGRLARVKRVDLLLDAWAELETEREGLLLLAGDGPESRRLREQASALGLERVRFEGEVEDIRSHLWAADVFVLPSRREGQSVALLEAMATALAPVGSDIPGNRGLVTDEGNGLLFTPDSVEDLRDSLRRMEEPELRREMGDRARQMVVRRHAVSEVVARHRQVYASLRGGSERRVRGSKPGL